MLMWLLAVALPLQGVSAATMLSCGGEHPAASTSTDPGHALGHAGSHMHDPMAGADHRTASAAHVVSIKSNLGKSAGHKCSACAACCLGAAVPSTTLSFDTIRLTDHFAPLATRTVAAFATGRLERPPRPFLA